MDDEDVGEDAEAFARGGMTHPNRLHARLAGQILRMLKDEGAEPGRRLLEVELCQQLGVSRTPVRGALKYLATQGVIQTGSHRGFTLAVPVTEVPDTDPVNAQQERDQHLLADIALARNTGAISMDVTQLQLCEHFDAKLPRVIRVMRQLAELGLVERKPGNGWSFLPSIDTPRTMEETYVFRQLIEPSLVLLPTFELDRNWLAQIKARHLALLEKPWRETLSIEYNVMNSDFHDGLARCTGNKVLLNTIQRLSKMRMLLSLTTEFPERPHDSTLEHLRIIEALEAGNMRVASALIADHLNHSKMDSLDQALAPIKEE